MEIKKIVITGLRQVELQEAEEKLSPKAREVLVKTDASYISAGTELSIYTAASPSVYNKGSWDAYPHNAGYANAGTIIEVGDEVTELKVGDRVFSNHPHRSHILLNVDTSLMVKIPDGVTQEEAAASRMAGVATSALLLARPKWHVTVAVFGLGNVGNLAAQSFKISGYRVIGIDPLAERRKIAKQCGIDLLLEKGTPEAVREICGGNLPQIVVDASGSTPVILDAFEVTANMGQLILLGSPRKAYEADIGKFLMAVHCRNITVQGALEWFLPLKPVKSIFNSEAPQVLSMIEKQQMIFDWIASGQMKVKPLISHRLSPAEAKKGYDGLWEKSAKFSGVIFDWNTTKYNSLRQ